MNQPVKNAILEDSVRLLVRHFGADRVRSVLERISQAEDGQVKEKRSPVGRSDGRSKKSVIGIIDDLREKDSEKYALLSDFYSKLNGRSVLVDTQDIREFAREVGLKEVVGRSRKEMGLVLMRFLVEQPTENLREALKGAERISEYERRQGYSVLTDKLMGKI